MKRIYLLLIIFLMPLFVCSKNNIDTPAKEKAIGFVSPCLPITIDYMNLLLFPINIVTSERETILSSSGSEYRSNCYWEETENKSLYLKYLSTNISNFLIKSNNENISILLENNKSIHGIYFPTSLLFNKMKKKFILFVSNEKHYNINNCNDLELSSLYLLDLDNNKMHKILGIDVNLNNEIIYNNIDDSIYFRVSKDTDNNCEYTYRDKQFLYGYNLRQNKSIGYILPKNIDEDLLKR